LLENSVPRRAAPAFLLASCLAAALAGFTQAYAAAPPATQTPPAAPIAPDTDQPLWRATHGVLLGVGRAGNRLVAVGDRGIILLSDDQGATWREVRTGKPELLTAVLFTTPEEGWAVGQDSTILHTTDAGEHWTAQTKDDGNDQALFSIASLGAGHLIATGAYALVLETTDGQTWTPDKLPNLDEDYHLNCVMAHIGPSGGDDVVITGEAGHAFVRHGTAWTPIPVGYDGSQFGCLTRSDGSMYSFGLRGSLFVSTASTPAWTRIPTGEDRSLFGGTVLANGLIALVGSNGLMLLLDPHTNTLRKMAPVTGATLSGIVETPDGKWVVVGDDGVHTVDPASLAASAEVTQ
jgi:photosystem II stability/assembly factor-like uncharacterized protein